ncbi:MAG: hypothetical protein ACOC1G_04355 [Phycisphaeraceae bacterium]
MTRREDIELNASKARLLREAHRVEHEAEHRIQRAATGMQLGSATLGLLMGHRGARRFAITALRTLTEAASWLKPRS